MVNVHVSSEMKTPSWSVLNIFERLAAELCQGMGTRKGPAAKENSTWRLQVLTRLCVTMLFISL